MCSYATSTTSSGRNGSHERSLPWLQRLCRARHSLPVRSVNAGPLLPGMIGERVLPVWREEFHQLAALLLGETRAHADVLQRAGIVIEAKQQRADRDCLRPPCASETRPPRNRSRARASL